MVPKGIRIDPAEMEGSDELRDAEDSQVSFGCNRQRTSIRVNVENKHREPDLLADDSRQLLSVFLSAVAQKNHSHREYLQSLLSIQLSAQGSIAVIVNTPIFKL
jgi:hypothetical protein